MRIGNSLRNSIEDGASKRFAIGALDLSAIGNAIVRIRAPVRMGTFHVSQSIVADIRFDLRWQNQEPIIGNVNITFTPPIRNANANLFGIHVAKNGIVHAEADSKVEAFKSRAEQNPRGLETLLREIGVALDEATFQVEPHRDAPAAPSLDTFGIRAWTVSSGDSDLFVGDLT